MFGLFKKAAEFVGDTVKSFFHNPVNALPAVVGYATGNPWLAGLTGAGVGASSGGGMQGALTMGLTSGLGAYAGQGSYIARYLGGSPVFQGMTTALGTGIGSSILNSRYGSASQPQYLPPPKAPSFDELKAAAAARTQEEFEREGLNRIATYDSPFRRAMSENTINIYNRKRFKPLKKAMKRLE